MVLQGKRLSMSKIKTGEIMRKDGRKYILMMVFLLFGIAVAMQFKSTLIYNRQSASSALNMENLKQQLIEEQTEAEKLKTAIDENLSSKEKLIKAHLEQESDKNLEAEWKKAKLIAGITDVKGPGIVIKLDDASVRQKDVDVRWQIIHDNDIRTILNLLKIAGAQSISINGERITPISEQVCAGPTVLINRNRYPVPYVINAIGNPDELYNAVNNSEVVAIMLEWKIRVEISKNESVTIPKFSNTDNIGSFISGLEAQGK